MNRSWGWSAGCFGLVMSTLACGGGGGGSGGEEHDASRDACPPALSYDRVGKPFVEAYCLTCHASGAGDRRGAPGDANFDTFAGIRSHGVLMHTFVQEGRMPPPEFPDLPEPSAQERDTYVAWLECSGVSRSAR